MGRMEKVGLGHEMKREVSEVVSCGHCGNRLPMKVLLQHGDFEADTDYGTGNIISPVSGTYYEVLKCQTCERLILRSSQYNDCECIEVPDLDYAVLYPSLGHSSIRGLPSRIASAYEAARRVRSVDANAYGVLVGRVLEMVCQDRLAKGKSLSDQIKDMADRGDIPPTLAEVAHGIRNLRNVGAHADIGDLTPAEAPVLEGLLTALLEYLYSAPLLVQEAKQKLDALKSKTP